MIDSPAQDDWVAIAEKVRIELSERVKIIKTMEIDEIHTLICCVRDAFLVEVNANSYDVKIKQPFNENY